LIERGGEAKVLVWIDDQVRPLSNGKAIVVGILNRTRGTGLETISAEEAAAHVQARLAVDADRLCGSGVGAGATAIRALAGIKYGQAAKTLRHGWRRSGGILHRAMALLKSGEDDL